MKRKPGVEIFERLLQTIVAPLVVAGGCLAFVLTLSTRPFYKLNNLTNKDILSLFYF